MKQKIGSLMVFAALTFFIACGGTKVVVVHPAPGPQPMGFVATVPVTPVPPAEVTSASPGPDYVWVQGYYNWDGTNYHWVSGSWVKTPNPGATWIPAHWQTTNGGYVWVAGAWQ